MVAEHKIASNTACVILPFFCCCHGGGSFWLTNSSWCSWEGWGRELRQDQSSGWTRGGWNGATSTATSPNGAIGPSGANEPSEETLRCSTSWKRLRVPIQTSRQWRRLEDLGRAVRSIVHGSEGWGHDGGEIGGWVPRFACMVQAPHEVQPEDHGTSHQAHGGGVESGAGQERERGGGGFDEVDLHGQDAGEPVRREGWRYDEDRDNDVDATARDPGLRVPERDWRHVVRERTREDRRMGRKSCRHERGEHAHGHRGGWVERLQRERGARACRWDLVEVQSVRWLGALRTGLPEQRQR